MAEKQQVKIPPDCRVLLERLASCRNGTGLPMTRNAAGVRQSLGQGWVEIIGCGVLRVVLITPQGRLALKRRKD